MPCARQRTTVHGNTEETERHGYVDGWDWVWMTTMVGIWIVLVGTLVYSPVRLAQRDRHDHGKHL